jgi:hypothetical protein
MSYFPQGLGPGQQRLGMGPAIALGAAAALGVALVVGVISGLSNIQFAYGAVLVGLCAGLVIRRSRTDQTAGLAGAVVAVIFSAVSSLVAFTTHFVKAGLTLSYTLANVSQLPHYMGFLGFLFWALGGYVGWATVTGRGRRRRVRTGFGGRRPVSGGPYSPPMYGAPGGPMPGASGQPFFTGGPGQPGYGNGPGQPGYGAAPGQPGYAAGPGQPGDPWAQGQPGFGAAPGFGTSPGSGTDQGFGGQADQPPAPPAPPVSG